MFAGTVSIPASKKDAAATLAHMDHSLYPYSALPARETPPDKCDAGLQAYALLCLEHWDALPSEGAVRDPRFVGEFGSFTPDYRSWTQREYGLRVGLFRVLDALRDAGIRPAVAANARVLQRLPRVVEQLNEWGCEWVAHGLSANELMHARMSMDEQRAHIAQALDAFQTHAGHRPAGWLSQDWGTTPDTFTLLAEAGLRYTLDWCNDDQGYLMSTAPKPLVALPLSAEWDDVQCQWLRHLTPRAHADLTLQAFDQLRAECAQHQRAAVFGLALHPWLCGMSSRIAALRQLLQSLRARADVQWTHPGALGEQLQAIASS
jgi:allantoinase